MIGLFTKSAVSTTEKFFQINHVSRLISDNISLLIIDRDERIFSVSVCGINRKKFTSVPVKVVDIHLHFHEQLLMSQDKSIYNLRVEGK